MSQIWIVTQDESQPYESWEWPLAAFTSEEAAQAYAEEQKKISDAQYEINVADRKKMEAEMDALPDNLTRQESMDAELAIYKKYPNAHGDYGCKPRFRVEAPLPLNPEA